MSTEGKIKIRKQTVIAIKITMSKDRYDTVQKLPLTEEQK